MLFDLGKYKAIVVSVAMFIILDAGVLMLNFYIASQIASDATNVNLAGRQRMLSQKIVKSLFDYRYAVEKGLPADSAFNEMSEAMTLFDKTINAFKQGGETFDAAENEIYLAPVDAEAATTAVNQGLSLWQPLKEDFEKLQTQGVQDGDLKRLVENAQAVNLTLLKRMNDLTNALEQVAKDKSTMLRMIQASAILLAVLNFFLILFHFIGQLRKSDAAAEKARNETTEILKTVHEGLLLVDEKLTIGTQYSNSIRSLFGEREYAGLSFKELLQSLIAEDEMQTVEEYIKLLLNKDIKEKLVGSLNPLVDVEVSLKALSGRVETKHLSFRFNRTIVDGKIEHILVTILDITETVNLTQELDRAKERMGNDLRLSELKQLAQLDASELHHFLVATESSLISINEIFKDEEDQDYQHKASNAMRVMHQIKGDAGALGIKSVAQAAHEFEDKLVELKQTAGLEGTDFLPLTLALNDMLTLSSELGELASVLKPSQGTSSLLVNRESASKSYGINTSAIEKLAKDIADSSGKKVDVKFDIAPDVVSALSERRLDLLNSSIVQLVRNAVVHGIEQPETRQANGKSAVGQISVVLLNENENHRLTVKDDGAGINIQRVYQTALSKGLHTEEELEAMTRTKLLSLIFKPEFSTSTVVDDHSGRGVGMDVVRANINRMKGRIRLSTRDSEYCAFSCLIPKQSTNHKESTA